MSPYMRMDHITELQLIKAPGLGGSVTRSLLTAPSIVVALYTPCSGSFFRKCKESDTVRIIYPLLQRRP